MSEFFIVNFGDALLDQAPDDGSWLPFTGAWAVFVTPGDSPYMATAAAITQLADSCAIMRARYVIIGMAGGAIRLVCSEWPGNHLVVGCMAVNAEYSGSVVTGISWRVMSEINQLFVLWHRSQSRVVTKCVVDFPVAVEPL